jgi:CO/xanthine dehydrogenase FAD-binding subunit
VEQIVGVQFRNLATVGGSIFGRYGFSDVLTILLALDADVELVEKGRIPLREFAQLPYDRDVLAYIYIPKTNQQVHYDSIRNQATDFPVLTCAVARTNGKVKAVIGARPQRAIVIDAPQDMDCSTPEGIDAFASYVQENTPVDTNQRAAKEYRSAMCKVLTRRGLKEIEKTYGI